MDHQDNLERFYPTDDPDLGVTASPISEDAINRHWRRYRWIADELALSADELATVCDIGSGSGYGTNLIRQQGFKYVFGVEPDDTARAYATKWHPECRFTDEPIPGDVAIFCESLEHMSPGESKQYIGKNTKLLFLTTPIVEKPNNPFHPFAFKSLDEVWMAARRLGFGLSHRWSLWCGQRFTDETVGEQFLGIFQR